MFRCDRKEHEREMRSANDSTVETVNAAATALVSAESRVQPTSVQKRRWGRFWSGYWCFGFPKHGKRFGHAVLVPEPMVSGTSAPETENRSHPPTIVLPFVAPPSSPASFLPSEPPSSTHSPHGLLSLSLAANSYSPGPNSIFAIGPYAHETQLVSPPVFSTFTTEPSTAPFTPPPEPLHLTTPSSPEVPFAQLLTSSLDGSRRNSEARQIFPNSHYEFQSYQLYPGSPVGHLISPSSVISGSGTCSPFPDREYSPGGYPFLEFRTGEPPKLWTMDGFTTSKWRSQQGSGTQTPDTAGLTSQDSFLPDNQISEVASLANSDNVSQNGNHVIEHRVSFELTGEEFPKCVDKEPVASVEVTSEPLSDSTVKETTIEEDTISREVENTCESNIGETSSITPATTSELGTEQEPQHQQQPSLTSIGSVKEFKFDNTDGGTSDKPTVNSDWWANEKVVTREAGPHNNWTFFPMLQPGFS